MARESQPPPPLAIADLHEKLDNALSLNNELANANKILQQENNTLNNEVESAQSTLAKVTSELVSVKETLAERDAEIKFLQEQLEYAVNEVQVLKSQQSQSIITAYSDCAPKGVATPIKLVQDMKDRLKVISNNGIHNVFIEHRGEDWSFQAWSN
jgi:predicted nuclease with TOPRIM domain